MAKAVTIDFIARTVQFEKAISRATARLKQFERESSTLGKGIASAFSGLAGKAALLFGGAASIGGIASTLQEIDRLKASLETVSGSAEAAQDSFRLISDFASQTPYDLAEVTQSFIKMQALGLQPTVESMRAFGNVASAMGKSFDQFVEAVADAVTGEFERLKEFGIKARKEGDQVAFTFQGVTKRVQNSAGAIQDYLQNIGNEQFAGAMERQMDTIGGAVNRLTGEFDLLINRIGEAGANDAIASFINGLADATRGLSDQVERGSFSHGLLDRLLGNEPDSSTLRGLTQQVRSVEEELERLYRLRDSANQERGGFFSFLTPSIDLDAVNAKIAELEAIQERLQLKAFKFFGGSGESTVDVADKTETAIDKLRAAVEKLNAAGKSYANTLKLFKEDAQGPFREAASAAEKTSVAYRLLSNALDQAKKGQGNDTVAAIDQAAEAINRLKEEGIVSKQVIEDMKASLAEAFRATDSNQIELVTTIDENGVVEMTDKATQKAIEYARQHPIIIPVKPVLIEGSASAFFNNIPEFPGGFADDLALAAEKSGSK